MSDAAESRYAIAAKRARHLFRQLDDLLETLLGAPDKDGIKASARDLGVLQGDEIVIGDDDEQAALLDHYLFIADSGDGRTRLEHFVETPPQGLDEDQLRILQALPDSHVGLLESREMGHKSDDHHVTARDLVYPERPLVTFAAHQLTPFDGLDQCFAMRVVEVDGQWLCTDLAMAVPQNLRKFFLRRGPIHELASLMKGAAGEAPAGTIDDDEAEIDPRTMLRAVFGLRLASHLAVEDGETLVFAKKRSLARPPQKRRRKRK